MLTQLFSFLEVALSKFLYTASMLDHPFSWPLHQLNPRRVHDILANSNHGRVEIYFEDIENVRRINSFLMLSGSERNKNEFGFVAMVVLNLANIPASAKLVSIARTLRFPVGCDRTTVII